MRPWVSARLVSFPRRKCSSGHYLGWSERAAGFRSSGSWCRTFSRRLVKSASGLSANCQDVSRSCLPTTTHSDVVPIVGAPLPLVAVLFDHRGMLLPDSRRCPVLHLDIVGCARAVTGAVGIGVWSLREPSGGFPFCHLSSGLAYELWWLAIASGKATLYLDAPCAERRPASFALTARKWTLRCTFPPPPPGSQP